MTWALDLDAEIRERHNEWERERLAPAEIALFSGDMTLRGFLEGHIDEDVEFVENDTGTALIRLPIDHYLAEWIVDFRGRAKRDVHMRFRKQGAQWDGRMERYRIDYDG